MDADGSWCIIKCIPLRPVICNSGFRSRWALPSPPLTQTSVWKILTPRIQKPFERVSHAGTNYYISNIESNISHITGLHATQNRFTGTAQFFEVIFDFLGHLRSCREKSKYQCKVMSKQVTLHCQIKIEQVALLHRYFQPALLTWHLTFKQCRLLFMFCQVGLETSHNHNHFGISDCFCLFPILNRSSVENTGTNLLCNQIVAEIVKCTLDALDIPSGFPNRFDPT